MIASHFAALRRSSWCYAATLAAVLLSWITQVAGAEINDTFAGPTDAGWLHYTPLAASGTTHSFVVTNGTYALGVGPSKIPLTSSSLVGSIRTGIKWTTFDISIEFSGWDVGARTNTAIFLVARQTGPTNTAPYGPFNGYALTIQPTSSPDLADDINPQARLVLSLLDANDTTTIATADLRDLKPGSWYTLRFIGRGSQLTGRVSLADAPTISLAEVSGTDSTYPSGFFSIGIQDQAAQGGTVNRGAHAVFRNLHATDSPTEADLQSLPPQVSYTLTDDFEGTSDAAWTHVNPFAAFGVNGTFELSNGRYVLSSPPSPAPTSLGATVAAIRPEVDWSDFQTSVDFTGWSTSSKTNIYILSAARGRVNPDGTFDFYAVRVVHSGNVLIPGVSPNPFIAVERWDHNGRSGVGNIASLQATTALAPSKTYRIVFTGQWDLLSGRLYELPNTNTPIAQCSLIDSTLRRGFVGLLAIDRFALNQFGNVGVRVAFDNFAAAGTPATLAISPTGTLQWPSLFTGYQLQQSPAPAGPWTLSTLTGGSSGTNVVVNPGLTGTNLYFRLTRP